MAKQRAKMYTKVSNVKSQASLKYLGQVSFQFKSHVIIAGKLQVESQVATHI